VLQIVLQALEGGASQSEIVNQLNNAGIPSSTGETWTMDAYKSVLKRIRQKKGPYYLAILELCFKGEMHPAQFKPLFPL
jgi:hypothetical protein